MNKKMLIVIGGVVALLGIGGVTWWLLQPKTNDQPTQGQENKTYAGVKEACNYLTQEVAVKVLGPGAEKGTTAPAATSDDISVSTCTYTSKVGNSLADIKNMRVATLLVRSPLSAVGAESNDVPFDSLKVGAITVQGYGEKAYWDPELGQLNVLKGGTWLIISLGKTTMGDKSVDDAKQLANLIVPQF
jgi:hypothetical protein